MTATSGVRRQLLDGTDELKAQEKILEILNAAAVIYNKDKPAA